MAQASPTTRSGHIFNVVQINAPSPGKEAAVLLAEHLSDGVMSVSFLATRQLKAQILEHSDTHEGEALAEVTSCEIINPKNRPFLLDIAWTPDHAIRISVNGETVGTTIAGEQALDRYTIPEKPKRAADHYDFEKENRLAFSKRNDKLVGAKLVRNRIRMDDDYLFAALTDEVHLIEDSLDHIKAGETHHVKALARSLRTVVANEKPLPLLQLCAAKLKEPLIVYTNANPRLELPVQASKRLIFDVTPEPTELFGNPVDIDVWFELPAGSTSDAGFTHKELVLAVANSVASHVRQDIHPLVLMLKSTSAHFRDGVDSDALLHFIRLLGETTLALARSLIDRSSQTSGPNTPQ